MGFLDKRWSIKKLEIVGVTMPRFVTLELWWREGQLSPTHYDMYKTDIEEMVMNYEQSNQALLFTFVEMETWKQWVWDQLHREPHKVKIVKIKF